MIPSPYNLKCEYLTNPNCIDTLKPRFSWLIDHQNRNQNQTAFQIIVSSDYNTTKSEVGDMWDSGKIISEDHINICYNGKALNSDSIYYWRVKWWDKNDQSSDFSEVNIFETALFNELDWKGKWVSRKEFTDKKTKKQFQYKSEKRGMFGRIKEVYAVYMRKEFVISKEVKSAKAYICGLGYYELRINGKKVGNRILEPAQTDYKKIALYSTYDITNLLKESNAVGVVLGNGRCIELNGYDFPKFVLQINIHYYDGNNEIIYSDKSWRVSSGPILENGIYEGETYDARLEMPGWDSSDFDDTNWDNVIEVSGYKIASQMMQPIQITKTLKPKELYSPKPGMYIYDFGQNFSGFVKLKVQGRRGTRITLRFSELVLENGTLNTATNGKALVTDNYILKGEGIEIFQPHFTYHGFRYVELTGFPGVPSIESLEGLFLHSNVPKAGDFYCSNKLINQIHSNIIWGQLSNLMSIPTDCPQRDERQGWMGDAQLTVEEAIFNFDMARFYIKYLRDIKLCQRDDGAISDVVPPYWRLYPADPAWGTAYITIAWYVYWYYNDTRVLEDHYDSIKNYVDYLSSIAKENIIYIKKFGDWCPPSSIVSRKTPVELTSTWYYYHDTLYLSRIAEVLGKQEDTEFYYKKAEEIKSAFNNKFLKRVYDADKLSHVDRTVSQTSNILPLYLTMVPERKIKLVLSTLIGSIKNDFDYHFDTGIIGTRYIFDVLTDKGYPEVVYKMINQRSFPGYGYMIREGATTLWERWEKLEGGGMNSHNHIMLGSVDTWFYKTLVGITSREPGWKKLRIKPYIPKDMSHAVGSINTIRGVISSSWEKIEDTLKLNLNIPVACETEVWIPIEKKECIIQEGDKILWNNGKESETTLEIHFKEIKDQYAIFSIGSGFYEFKVEQIKDF